MFRIVAVIASCFIGTVLLIIGIGWLAEGNDFLLFRYFAPKREAVRRDVFEQSKAYNDGMAQELRQAQLDWVRGDKDQKAAIASIVLHRTAGYPTKNLPPDLSSWVASLSPSTTTTSYK